MKKLLLSLGLVVMMLFGAALADTASPYTMDRRFMDDVSGTMPFLKWTRSVTSALYEEGGWPVAVIERTQINGREYSAWFIGTETQTYQLNFYGWYQDMQMDDGNFRDGLMAYNVFMRTAYTILPDDMDADCIYSPYDFYNVLARGRPYDDSGLAWHPIWEGPYILEATHERTGDYMLAAREDDGSVMVLMQIW